MGVVAGVGAARVAGVPAVPVLTSVSVVVAKVVVVVMEGVEVGVDGIAVDSVSVASFVAGGTV